jgi:peroxiredoxin
MSDSSSFYAVGPRSKMFSKQFGKALSENKKHNKKQIGKVFPNIEFTDIEGNKYQLSLLKGKMLVLNFWFIGCKPCLMEIPGLNSLVKEYEGQNISFLAFANDKTEALQYFLKKNEYLYRIIPDAFLIAKQNNILSFPTNIIIDRNGRIVFFESAYSNSTVKNIRRKIKKMLD